VKLLTRLLLTALLALGLGLGAPGPAHADNGEPHRTTTNLAQAVNTTDGSSLFEFAFAIHKAAGDIVDNTNAAIAMASCTSCQTVAIAIEIVLVTGSPTTFTPQNVAIAYNEHCNLCDTFASAYQFVVQSQGPVHFTHDGKRQLEAIRREIASWGRRGLTPAQMREKLPALMQQVQDILRTQLVSRRRDGGGDQNGDQGDENHTDTSQGPTTSTPTNGAETTTGGGSVTVPADTGSSPATTDTTTTGGTTTTGPTTTTTP
jgi:putative peptide zinc metalloprotease protein